MVIAQTTSTPRPVCFYPTCLSVSSCEYGSYRPAAQPPQCFACSKCRPNKCRNCATGYINTDEYGCPLCPNPF